MGSMWTSTRCVESPSPSEWKEVVSTFVKLKVVVEPGEQGGFVGSIPALPGCLSQGRTHEELLANLREAAEGWLEAEQDKIEAQAPADVELLQV
ncbi:hypothetical protein BH11ARM2_BH11ARM2_03390 [soil metagenome]